MKTAKTEKTIPSPLRTTEGCNFNHGEVGNGCGYFAEEALKRRPYFRNHLLLFKRMHWLMEHLPRINQNLKINN